MKSALVFVAIFACLSSFAQDTFKNVGKFNCKSTAIVFPYETPQTLFTLRLEADITTKEYDLSSSPNMSKATIQMAYMFRKSTDTHIQEQGNFKGEALATTIPYSNNDYFSASYKIVANSNVQNYREIYLTLPTNFNLYRNFAISLRLGEVERRNTNPVHLSCENLNYMY